MPHRYDEFMDAFSHRVQADRARPYIYTDKSQMEIWPDDADEEEMRELWELVLGSKGIERTRKENQGT